MIVTATEFKINLGKYLDLAKKQDIFITKNGKNIARLTAPMVDRMALLDGLAGVAASQEDIDEDEIREKRMAKQ